MPMILTETGRSVPQLTLLMVGLAVCGVIVAGLVIGYGEYSETHWVPSAGWVGLAGYTLLIFGTLIRDFRPSWKRAWFWATLAGLLAVHLAAYATVLMLIPEWRLIWFLPISVVEFPVLMSILCSLGYRNSPFLGRRRDKAKAL